MHAQSPRITEGFERAWNEGTRSEIPLRACETPFAPSDAEPESIAISNRRTDLCRNGSMLIR
jgi:hypothetical protein